MNLIVLEGKCQFKQFLVNVKPELYSLWAVTI